MLYRPTTAKRSWPSGYKLLLDIDKLQTESLNTSLTDPYTTMESHFCSGLAQGHRCRNGDSLSSFIPKKNIHQDLGGVPGKMKIDVPDPACGQSLRSGRGGGSFKRCIRVFLTVEWLHTLFIRLGKLGEGVSLTVRTLSNPHEYSLLRTWWVSLDLNRVFIWLPNSLFKFLSVHLGVFLALTKYL